MYITATGEIIWHVNVKDLAHIVIEPTQNVLEGIHPKEDYYIVEGAPTLRPEMGLIYVSNLNIKVDEVAVITNIPANTIVLIEEEELLVTDGQLEVSFNLVGTFSVVFKNFPYIEEFITYEVTL